MLRTRVIPCLQLLNENLVKTVKFKKPYYIGDFANTARIFNELEVDELCLLSIRATVNKSAPNFTILQQVANECFMPLSYGGGVSDFDTAKQILTMGYEKIIVNSACFRNPDLITQISEHFGAQSVIVAIDFKKNIFGKQSVYSSSGQVNEKLSVLEWAQLVEERGAGEIMLSSIENEGTWGGYDLETTKLVAEHLNIPVIANGGAGHIEDLVKAKKVGKASALALGSMVVYQKKGMGVLINFPSKENLDRILK